MPLDATTELARYANRQHAISERGDGYTSGRRSGGPVICGPGRARSGARKACTRRTSSSTADPGAGSRHYGGEQYKLVLHDGRVRIVAYTGDPGRDHAAQDAPSAGVGGHGNGGGDDGEIAAQVLGWERQGLAKEAAYVAAEDRDPRDPAWPFERGDFERHHRTALAKVAATPAPSCQPVRWSGRRAR